MEKLNKEFENVFVWFAGELKEDTGKSWCPDCSSVEGPLMTYMSNNLDDVCVFFY